MKVLAFDCAAKTMAVAVGVDDRVVAADFSGENRNHAPYLMPMIHDVLATAGMTVADMDALAVTVGPGSFTGLRIGVATAKGFVDLLDIPTITLSTLDALAQNLRHRHGILVPILDARKSQVYAAVYDNREGKMTKIVDDRPLVPTEELAELLAAQGLAAETPLVFGDAVPNWEQRLREHFGDDAIAEGDVHGVRGEALVALAAQADTASLTREPMPVYLRGVDAKAKFTDDTIDMMKEGDIPELVELDKTCFPRPWSAKMFHDELTNGYGRYWVLRGEGRILAYGGFWLVAGECHITNIAVHADHRHTGRGRAMLEHLIAMAKLYGAHAITLEVRPGNDTALHLYESHGFRREGLRKHYYEDNGEDAVIMWLRFPADRDEKPWR